MVGRFEVTQCPKEIFTHSLQIRRDPADLVERKESYRSGHQHCWLLKTRKYQLISRIY